MSLDHVNTAHSLQNLRLLCLACHAVGLTLEQIKAGLPLTPGPLPADSLQYANQLLASIGNATRAYLDEPLVAIFVKFNQWQLEQWLSP